MTKISTFEQAVENFTGSKSELIKDKARKLVAKRGVDIQSDYIHKQLMRYYAQLSPDYRSKIDNMSEEEKKLLVVYAATGLAAPLEKWQMVFRPFKFYRDHLFGNVDKKELRRGNNRAYLR